MKMKMWKKNSATTYISPKSLLQTQLKKKKKKKDILSSTAPVLKLSKLTAHRYDKC